MLEIGEAYLVRDTAFGNVAFIPERYVGERAYGHGYLGGAWEACNLQIKDFDKATPHPDADRVKGEWVQELVRRQACSK